MISIRFSCFACWIFPLFLTNLLFASTPPKSGKICIAVLFNSTKSNISGGDRYVGVFTRENNESEWRNIYHTNLFTLGLGYFQSATTQRLYLAAGNGLHCSSDGGKTWKLLTGWEIMEVLSVTPDPVDSMVIYIATPFGIYKSTDDGKSWKAGMGMPATAIYAIHASADGKEIYAGGFQTGVWRSEDMGQSWQQIWPAPEIEAIYSLFVDPTDANHLMAGTNGKGVYESFDKGKTWKHAGMDGAHVKQIARSPFL